MLVTWLKVTEVKGAMFDIYALEFKHSVINLNSQQNGKR